MKNSNRTRANAQAKVRRAQALTDKANLFLKGLQLHGGIHAIVFDDRYYQLFDID